MTMTYTGGEPITANDNATAITAIIDRVGREGRTDQYIRELIVNGAQAQADTVLITPVRPSAVYDTENELTPEEKNSIGVKIAVVDNGYGMSGSKLDAYMGTLFSGASAIGRDKNFQMGSRVSTLPISPLGVIIASWTEDDPEGNLVRLEYDENQRLYVRHRFFWETQNEETGHINRVSSATVSCEVDPSFAALKHPIIEKAGHGTVVILLGSRPEDHTYGQLQRGKGESEAVIYPTTCTKAYLRVAVASKFMRLPGDLKQVHVVHTNKTRNLENWNKTLDVDEYLQSVGTNEAGPSARAIKGLYEAFTNTRHIETHGSTPIRDQDGITVATAHWGIMQNRRPKTPEREGYDGFDLLDHKPLFGELYQGEIYNPYHDNGANRWLDKYGINIADVKSRMIFLVEPSPKGPNTPEASPNSARSQLMLGDTSQLPHEQWGDFFIKDMPSPIQELLDASINQNRDKQQEKDEKDFRDKVSKWFSRPIPSRIGQRQNQVKPTDLNGDGAGNKDTGGISPTGKDLLPKNHSSARKRRIIIRPKAGGGEGLESHETSSRAARNNIPDVQVFWDETGAQFRDERSEHLCTCTKTDTSEKITIFINGSHDHLKLFINDQVEQRNPKYEDDIRNALKRSLEFKVKTYVISALTFTTSERAGAWARTSKFKANALSDEALSSVLLDLQTLDLVVGRAIGGRSGWGKITKNKTPT